MPLSVAVTPDWPLYHALDIEKSMIKFKRYQSDLPSSNQSCTPSHIKNTTLLLLYIIYIILNRFNIKYLTIQRKDSIESTPQEEEKWHIKNLRLQQWIRCISTLLLFFMDNESLLLFQSKNLIVLTHMAKLVLWIINKLEILDRKRASFQFRNFNICLLLCT